MSSIILKNVTDEFIKIDDLGLTIGAQSEINIFSTTTLTIMDISQSNDLLSRISSSKIVVNNGENDLSPAEGVRHCFQLSVLSGPRTKSNVIRVQPTPRALGNKTYYTGAGDDITNITNVGDGKRLIYHHQPEDLLEESFHLDFNMVHEVNETWIYEGYMEYKNALFDYITFKLVTRTVQVELVENTNYMIYPGYPMIFPAAGNGNVNILSDLTQPHGGLVYASRGDLGTRPAAYWNAEWDSQNNVYTNITPAPLGDGVFNIFQQEYTLVKFVNKVSMLGDGNIRLTSHDVDELGQGMRFKVTLNTHTDDRISDHEWFFSGHMTFHRRNTR